MTDSSKPGIPDIVAEAQKLIGVPPGSPQAVFVQGQVEKLVEVILIRIRMQVSIILI